VRVQVLMVTVLARVLVILGGPARQMLLPRMLQLLMKFFKGAPLMA
jgi:hypothetical protein